MLRRHFISTSMVMSKATSTSSALLLSSSSTTALLSPFFRSYGNMGGSGPNVGAGSFGTQQTTNKTSKYVNTQATAAPIPTACGRTFDPMTFQEMLQAVTDQSWATAIQQEMIQNDAEYIKMMTTTGGGGNQIDDLVTRGLGGSDDEAMSNLKRLLQSDYKASLSVCALQDAYVALREKRDLNQTKVAAGEAGAGAMKSGLGANRPGFGAGSGQGQ